MSAEPSRFLAPRRGLGPGTYGLTDPFGTPRGARIPVATGAQNTRSCWTARGEHRDGVSRLGTPRSASESHSSICRILLDFLVLSIKSEAQVMTRATTREQAAECSLAVESDLRTHDLHSP